MLVLGSILFYIPVKVGFIVAEFEMTRAVDDAIPTDFPVVLVWNEGRNVESLHYWQLDRFLMEYPQASFLIPRENESSLRQKVEKSSELGSGRKVKGRPYHATFSIMKEYPDGSQLISVSLTGAPDYYNTSYYRAYDRYITEKYHLSYFGPGISLYVALLSLIANAVLCGSGYVLWLFYKWGGTIPVSTTSELGTS